MKSGGSWGRRSWFAILLALSLTGLAAGSGHPGPPRVIVPDRTILLLEQDLLTPAPPAGDAVTYGGSAETDLLRQIAAATRASARGQIELLRQQNEIIRLLEELTRQRGPAR